MSISCGFDQHVVASRMWAGCTRGLVRSQYIRDVSQTYGQRNPVGVSPRFLPPSLWIILARTLRTTSAFQPAKESAEPVSGSTGMRSHATGWNSIGIGSAHRARARMIDVKLYSTRFLSLMIV